MQYPQDENSPSADVMEIIHQPLNNHTVVEMHTQGSTEGEHGGPPANNNNNNTNNRNDQESLGDEDPTEFVLKDKELFKILKAVSILVFAVIVISLAIFAIVYYSAGYPATNKLQKECIVTGLVGFVTFPGITVGVVHSVEGRANAIDLATTMVITEIAYGFFAVCHAAMVIGKPPWFIVVPLFLVAWSVTTGWLVWRYRRPRGIYVMLKKIFKFKMHGQ